MDHAHRGEAALASGKPEEAIEHYTHAIKESPSACAYYVTRSTAYQRTSRYQEAYADADVAVLIATKRAKRELMGQAQLRRAIALFHLERYGDSEFALALAKKYDEKEKTIGIWEAKLKTKLQGLDEGSEKRKVTIKERPNGDVPDANGSAKIVSATHVPIPSPPASATKQEPPSLSTAAQTPANKIRHDWYQNNDSVIVSLMVKGAPKDHTAVEIKDTSVSITFPLESGSSYDFSLDPLHSSVDPSTSTFKILSTKVELTLKKSMPGQKWSTLEDIRTLPTTTTTTTAAPQPSAPVYPTSSRTGPKNWDKIANSFVKPKAPSEPKNSQPSDTSTNPTSEGIQIGDDFEDEGGDPSMGFFKQIYANASDEMKRAMMKSYTESGGTALSTSWKDVSKKRVEVTPPDGMVERKWEL